MARKWAKKLAVLEPVGFPALLLVGVAVILGGGGSHSPLKNLLVEVVAAGLLAAYLFRQPSLHSRFGWPATFLLSAFVLIPLLQLFPLPPALWQSLPGRELALEARQLVNAEGEWFPVSLDRTRTAGALAAILVPIALLVSIRLDREDAKFTVLAYIVALGVLNFLVGGLQVLLGDVSLLGYPSRAEGRLYGFFANHNSTGLFFVVALCALGALALGSRLGSKWWLTGSVGTMFVLGVVLTQSRSSLALLAFVAMVLTAMTLVRHRAKMTRRTLMLGGGVALIMVAALAAVATNDRIGQTFQRFESLDDLRPAIWADTRSAIDRYWPVGSGTGTFDEVFQVDESLETLGSPRAGRAHNDYLELTLESGVIGLLVLGASLTWLLATWWRARRTGNRYLADCTGLGLLCIVLQSGIDYPLRNLAMLCLAACFVAVLADRTAGTRGRKFV